MAEEVIQVLAPTEARVRNVHSTSDLGSSSEEEIDDAMAGDGRRRHKTRRERIESPQYLKFASHLLKDPRRNKWASRFSIFFILVHLVADAVVATSLVLLTRIHPFIWKLTALIPAIAIFFVGRFIILTSAGFVLNFIHRDKGIYNSRIKLYFCCITIMIGGLLGLSLTVPFVLKDDNSISDNETREKCIENLDMDLIANTEDWTFDEEERLCDAFVDGGWFTIKAAFAATLCCQIAWGIILFEFCCLVMSIYNPSPEVWATYREYRRQADFALLTAIEAPEVARTSFSIERELSPIKVSSTLVTSRYLNATETTHGSKHAMHSEHQLL